MGIYSSSAKIFNGIHAADIDNDVAARIRYCMAEAGVTQSELARACGVGLDRINKYLNGHCREENMSIDLLKKIAAYLKKDTYYFCNDYLRFIDTADVPKELRKQRQEKGMSRKMFANTYGIRLDSYKGYEHGDYRLPYKYWKKIFCHPV